MSGEIQNLTPNPPQGMLILILKGKVSVWLTSLSLLVRNRLYQDKLRIYFHFQNNLVLTGEDKEVNHTERSLPALSLDER